MSKKPKRIRGKLTDKQYDAFGNDHAAIVSVEISTDSEADILNSNPLFGVDDAARYGQLVIKSDQTANESGVFIFS